MIIVQSLIKIVKTVNCKQIDQLKKKERKERNGTEQNRTTGLIGKRSKHIHTHTHTYIQVNAYHMLRKPAVSICMYVGTYIHIFYVLRLSTMLNQAKK